MTRPRDHTLDVLLDLNVLLDLDGQVLVVDLDNAHRAQGRKRGEARDHQHRLRTIKAYQYRDAATLLADFWRTVDAVLRERGVLR